MDASVRQLIPWAEERAGREDCPPARRHDVMVAMNFGLLQLLMSFGTLVLYVAVWAGVIFVRKSAAKLPWSLMTAGVLIKTLASILFLLTPLLDLRLFHSGDAYQWITLTSNFGNVMFAVGFALFGLQAARASSRLLELEQLADAMSEEMTRLKDDRAAS